MSAATDLETRLTAALTARTDQVGAGDLAPAQPPSTVRRLRPSPRATWTTLAAAAAVAVVATATVLGSAEDAAAPGPADSPSVVVSDPAPPTTDAGAPRRETAGDLQQLLDEDAAPLIDGPLELDEGGTVSIAGPDLRWTFADGETVIGELGEDDPARLRGVELQLGQAGSGVLVDYGDGEYARFSVYVPRASGDGIALAPAVPTEAVPFGRGFTEGEGLAYYSWTTGNGAGIYTRVQAGDPSTGRYRVYRWEVTGPGEGGGPDSAVVQLVPTDLGLVCFDFEVNAANRC